VLHPCVLTLVSALYSSLYPVACSHLTSIFCRTLPPLELEFLQGRLRIVPRPLEFLPYHPEPQDAQPATRLHEIILRIGEICLSPEMAHVMLFPEQALAYANNLTTPLDFPEAYHRLCHDGPGVLLAMRELLVKADIAEEFLSTFQHSCLPPPTTITYRQPLHVCAWRIEFPSRVLVFTGKHPQSHDDIAQGFMPHTLSKVLLDERSKRPVPSCIHLMSNDTQFTPDAIRDSLLYYTQTKITPHRERVSVQVNQRRGKKPVQQQISIQDQTLEEAAAVFVHPPLRNHSEIGLNQSPPWDKDHIDHR